MTVGHDVSRAKKTAAQTKTRGRKRASAATAQLEAMSDVLNGVVQRTLTVQGNTISEDAAINLIFKRLGKNAVEYADAVVDVVHYFNERDQVFTDDDDLFTKVMAKIDEGISEDDESGSDEERKVEFPLKLWNGEPEESMQKCLNKYELGEQLREGIDYKSVDKTAFAVEDNDDLAIVIRLKRVKGTEPLAQETKTLSQLSKAGLPAAKVIARGYYVLNGVAYPALLMTRYAISSKAFVRRVSGQIVRPDTARISLGKVLDTPEKVKTGLQSLMAIKSKIVTNAKLAVNDIQFLVSEDGNFFINDATETGSDFLESNVEVLNELESDLKSYGQETFQ